MGRPPISAMGGAIPLTAALLSHFLCEKAQERLVSRLVARRISLGKRRNAMVKGWQACSLKRDSLAVVSGRGPD